MRYLKFSSIKLVYRLREKTMYLRKKNIQFILYKIFVLKFIIAISARLFDIATI